MTNNERRVEIQRMLYKYIGAGAKFTEWFISKKMIDKDIDQILSLPPKELDEEKLGDLIAKTTNLMKDEPYWGWFDLAKEIIQAYKEGRIFKDE